MIYKINFYNLQQTLVQVGFEDRLVKGWGVGRVEVFEIAEDEQLIGCTLIKDDCFVGVTWMTMKVPRMLKSIYP